MKTTIYKWSSALVVTGALTLGTGYLLRIDIDKKEIGKISEWPFLLSTVLVAFGSLALLSGLPGFFASKFTRTGKSGLIASGLSFTGIAAFHLGTLALYFVLPVLANYNASTRMLLYSDTPPFPLFGLFWAISLLIQSVGLIWLSIKIWQAKLLPKIVSVMFLAGGILFIAAPAIWFPLIKIANTLVMIALVAACFRHKSAQYSQA